jgi:uncharacterized Ntn-hydrolase superfamily protein
MSGRLEASSTFARPTATYSIVAIDKEAGLMGVAAQSRWFSIGPVFNWAEPGTGVAITQSYIEMSYPYLSLAMLKAGKAPDRILQALLSVDLRSDGRQLAILDTEGRVAAYTGTNCLREAGHVTGDGFSVQANTMKNTEVWPSMASAFEKTRGPLKLRMMAALDAAEAAGGDLRGKQSACMFIVKVKPSGLPWMDRVIDLRVEDHPEPLKELRRYIRLQEAYEHAYRGDDLTFLGRFEEAMDEFKLSTQGAPEIEELKFWYAVTLARCGRVSEALPLFKNAFEVRNDWKEVLRRMMRTSFYTLDSETLERILSL